jgi:Transglycosylase SLT domain
VDGSETSGDRRHTGDRREGGEKGGRRGAARGTSPITYVLRALGAIIALLLVIVFTVRNMRPVYTSRGTLGEQLRKHAPSVASVIAPGDSSQVDQLMATPKFQQEKRNFFEDVMRLKQVDSARADSIAQYAVREAYVRGISPAIIFGVMLTENSRFVSSAQSNVGAVGLMQVYPKIWLTKEMSAMFGRDLATDSTNVKYGVFILSQYFNPRTKAGTLMPTNWATALLHYNGCVNGTNTPRCHSYPNKVKNFVESQATSICNGRGFFDCIAKPFVEGLFGHPDNTTKTPAASPPTTGQTGAPVQQAAQRPPVPAPPKPTAVKIR